MAATCRRKTVGNYCGGGLCLKNRRKLNTSAFMFGRLEAKAWLACRRRRRKIWRRVVAVCSPSGRRWYLARWLKVSCKSFARGFQGGLMKLRGRYSAKVRRYGVAGFGGCFWFGRFKGFGGGVLYIERTAARKVRQGVAERRAEFIALA